MSLPSQIMTQAGHAIFPDRETFRLRARDGNVVPVIRELLADMETPSSLPWGKRESSASNAWKEHSPPTSWMSCIDRSW
jgi:hypothetical protein